MSLAWIHESPPCWNREKASIVGGAEPGTFNLAEFAVGDLLPGEWWRVEDAGTVVGYGWIDTTWGDAEMLLAVDADGRRSGVGSFILDRLEEEAAARGLNYLYNVVLPGHPSREAVTAWLRARRFEPSRDGRLMRRVTRSPRT